MQVSGISHRQVDDRSDAAERCLPLLPGSNLSAGLFALVSTTSSLMLDVEVQAKPSPSVKF